MDKKRNDRSNPTERDDLLREGRRDDERVNPFEQASQTREDSEALTEEADAEQQLKEAMTERD